MHNEVSISEFLWAVKGKFFGILLATGACAGLGYYASHTMTPWYSYSFLIRSGKQGPSDPLGTLDKVLKNEGNDLKAEYITYMNYEYLNNKLAKEKPNLDAYVKSVESIDKTDFINVKIYGLSLEHAQKLGNEIFTHMQEMFSKRIDLELNSKKQQLDISKAAKAKLDASVKEIAGILKTVGRNEALEKKRIELEARSEELSIDIVRLERIVLSDDIRQFQVVSMRPESNKIAFPDPILFTVGGAVAGLVLSIMGLLMTLLSGGSSQPYKRTQVAAFENTNSGLNPEINNLVDINRPSSNGNTTGAYRARR